MANKTKTAATEPRLIAILVGGDVLTWSGKFGVSTVRLRNAVDMAGPMADDIELYPSTLGLYRLASNAFLAPERLLASKQIPAWSYAEERRDFGAYTSRHR